MNRLVRPLATTLLTAALLCGAGLASAADTPAAQTPQAAPQGNATPAGQPGADTTTPRHGGHHHRFDCSKTKDPAQCEEKRQAMRARMDEAKKSCEGKQGAEHRSCMREAMCAKSADPATCNERAQARAQRHQAAMAACKDKQGDDKRACLREQRRANAPAAPAATTPAAAPAPAAK